LKSGLNPNTVLSYIDIPDLAPPTPASSSFDYPVSTPTIASPELSSSFETAIAESSPHLVGNLPGQPQELSLDQSTELHVQPSSVSSHTISPGQFSPLTSIETGISLPARTEQSPLSRSASPGKSSYHCSTCNKDFKKRFELK